MNEIKIEPLTIADETYHIDAKSTIVDGYIETTFSTNVAGTPLGLSVKLSSELIDELGVSFLQEAVDAVAAEIKHEIKCRVLGIDPGEVSETGTLT